MHAEVSQAQEKHKPLASRVLSYFQSFTRQPHKRQGANLFIADALTLVLHYLQVKVAENSGSRRWVNSLNFAFPRNIEQTARSFGRR